MREYELNQYPTHYSGRFYGLSEMAEGIAEALIEEYLAWGFGNGLGFCFAEISLQALKLVARI